MATQLTHDLTYEAPVERVSAMLADPAFREEVCEAQGAIRHEVRVGGGRVVVDQVRPARGLPSFATRVVGDEINIVQTEQWRGETEADVEVVIPGKPGDMTGTARLLAEGEGTRQAVELTVKVKIPVVGGKLEGLITDILIKALEVENRVGRDYLGR